MDKIDELLTRGVENIIPGKEKLAELLRSGKKLNVYLGIDPTSTKIHVGHAVPLRKLQQFVELGHNVTFLIGDFTALIGDTSDKDSERPVLTTDQIQENFQTYKKQAEKILDFSKVSVHHNSEWLAKLTFEEIIKLCQHFSAGEFVSRELIKKRLTDGKKVGLHELLYPVMQGYDSFFMDTDIQLGGTDQTFNMQAGRTLQKDLRNKESYVISNGFLEGTDGRKMSKSWGNAIWLDDEPEDMFGKVMSLKDDLIIEYFTLATSLPMEEITEIKKELDEGRNPMVVKKTLAHQIVKELNDDEAAGKAQEHFESVFQKQDMTASDLPTFSLSDLSANPISAESLLVETNLASSKSEAKRLIAEGAVEKGGEVLDNNDPVEIEPGDMIRVGKKRFLRFI